MEEAVTLFLSRDEYEALLRGNLKPRRDVKIRFRRFKIETSISKIVERYGCKGKN